MLEKQSKEDNTKPSSVNYTDKQRQETDEAVDEFVAALNSQD